MKVDVDFRTSKGKKKFGADIFPLSAGYLTNSVV